MRAPIIQLAGPRQDRRMEGQHPGLILQRYLTKTSDDKARYPDERRELLGAAIRAAGSASLCNLYKLAFDRWKTSLDGAGPHRSEDLKSDGRLIVGLGSENVLETGIRLHHTYGLPLIPGSALKGLASHYCAQVWGQAEGSERFRKDEEYHDLLFGTTDDGGVIRFHDAWVLPWSVAEGCLFVDVMTPHHPEWQTDRKPPTDFDSPRPISFLSVAGTFHVVVSWSGPGDCSEGKGWIELAFTLLKQALNEWGIGGKTSSGYGRLDSAKDLPASKSHRAAASATPAKVQRKPNYEPGRRITVTRIADLKGKVKFQADDDFVGHFAGEIPPNVDVGKTTEVWVANVSPQGYTLTAVQPKSGKKGRK